MLEQLCENDFLARVGTACRASVGAIAFDLIIDSVSRYQRPVPPDVARIPFAVQLKGPLEPCFQYGMFTLEMPHSPPIHELYIERITAPIEEHKNAAYYQIVFA
jgi:hypothetical protein